MTITTKDRDSIATLYTTHHILYHHICYCCGRAPTPHNSQRQLVGAYIGVQLRLKLFGSGECGAAGLFFLESI